MILITYREGVKVQPFFRTVVYLFLFVYLHIYPQILLLGAFPQSSLLNNVSLVHYQCVKL